MAGGRESIDVEEAAEKVLGEGFDPEDWSIEVIKDGCVRFKSGDGEVDCDETAVFRGLLMQLLEDLGYEVEYVG